mmetsp:Transcript_10585/g.25926  ORF Transcript_10585/g.25926 Transcript_10585/m.25926 type:complete len:491 (-) Transcript_10585:10-1482(-)
MNHPLPLNTYGTWCWCLCGRAAGAGQGAQAQRVELDEAGGVLLVIRTPVVLEGAELGLVQRRGGLAAHHDGVTLVQLHAHRAVDVGAALVDGGLHHLALGRKPEPVVDELGVLGHQLVLEVALAAVQADGLRGAAGHNQHGATGGLVHAARLHAHEARLHQIQAPDAVLASVLVERGEHGGGAHANAVDGHGVALLELNLNVRRLVRRVLGRHRAREHVLAVLHPRVLQRVALVRDVQQVGVRGVRLVLALGGGDGDAALLGVLDEGGARVQVPLAPRRDHLDVRLQAVVPQLEPHLVVALARGAVAHGVSADLARDLNLALGDERARDGGAEEVGALIQGVGAEHGEHVVTHKLLAQVVDEDLLHAHLLRLGARRLQLLALPEVRGEGDDLAPVRVLQPLEDDGGVQPAAVRQHHLLDLAAETLLELRGDSDRAGASARGTSGARNHALSGKLYLGVAIGAAGGELPGGEGRGGGGGDGAHPWSGVGWD